jgi:hypothetical protein
MLQDIARLEDTKSRRLREKRTEALLKRLNGYVQDLKLLQADFEEILRMKDTITEGKNPEETQRLTELLEAAERRFRSLEERQQTPAATTDQADPEKNTPLAENLRESTSQRLRQKAQQIIESQNEEDQQIALDEMREELERIKIWSRTRHDE